MHPPYQGGTGYVFAITPPVALPAEPKAALRCEVGKADGSDTGDGILFRIAVVDSKGKETIVAEKPWLQHAWTPLEADLSPWAGQRVRLKLISDVGPKDNSSGDWASWAEMRLESLRPTLQPTLHDKPVELRHRPGPFPLKNVRLDDLRKAKSRRASLPGHRPGQQRPIHLLRQPEQGPAGHDAQALAAWRPKASGATRNWPSNPKPSPRSRSRTR